MSRCKTKYHAACIFFNALPSKKEETSKQLGIVVPFCTIFPWQSSYNNWDTK